METLNVDPFSVGTTIIAVVLILKLVFDFLAKWKTTNGPTAKANEKDYIGFTEAHAQCLAKIAYQVNEMHTGLQINKDLQRALAGIIDMQSQQIKILNQLTDLMATSLQLLEKSMDDGEKQ